MDRCPHVQWLGLEGLVPNWALLDSDRLNMVINQLRDPLQQFPSLLLFLGTKSKTTALRGLYVGNNPTRRPPHGIANLHVDSNTTESEQPIIFADCTVKEECSSLNDGYHGCHDQSRFAIYREQDDPVLKLSSMVTYVHLNLLFPFTHVVCIFADDFGGNVSCSQYIDNWIQLGTEQDARGRPQLVIVTSQLTGIDAFVQIECSSKFSLLFDSLAILTSDVSACPSDPASQFLQTRLRCITDDVREDRRARHLLFSALHVAEAFSAAVPQFARNPRRAVDMLRCFAQPLISWPAFHTSLNAFFAVAANIESPPPLVFDFIASTMLVHAYRAQTHRGCMDTVSWSAHLRVLT